MAQRIEKGQKVMFDRTGTGKYGIGEAMESGESTIAVLYIRKTDGGAERHDVHASKLIPLFWSDALKMYVTIPGRDEDEEN